MYLNIKIGPYKLVMRTEYSKIKVYDENGKDITDSKKESEKIIKAYLSQKKDPDKYFNAADGKLYSIKDDIDIEYVFIPNTINHIMYCAISSSKIKFINIPDTVTAISESTFRKCDFLEEIVLPNSIKSLSEGMFINCTSLKKIVLPNDVLGISKHMFGNCESLKEITLPDSVRIIEENAFWGCYSLKKINIPKNLVGFGEKPFEESNITTLIFNHNLKDIKNPKIGFKDFLNNSNISTLEISNNVDYIDPNFLKYTKHNIKTIDYKGSYEEFEKFKENNKSFLKLLGRKINIKVKDVLDLKQNEKTSIENTKLEEIDR